MEGVIFMGIQATGKSTFYKERFFNTHFRVSMDLLNTRNKEGKLLDACIELQQKIVIDNTNPTIEERAKYIQKFKERKYKTIGYYFCSKVEESLERNSKREGKERIPDVGIFSTKKRLVFPNLSEGFDELYYVEIRENGFYVKDWNNEV